MYPELERYVQELESSFGQIPDERKETLRKLASYIRDIKDGTNKAVKLNFICTHNSRRSHLAQVWAALAAYHYGIDTLEAYSGGTEATAFNPRAVAALERAGLKIQNPGGDNPRYQVSWAEEAVYLTCFSKTFDDAANPHSDFAAIMTCSDADEKCPNVNGADFRIAITYTDPKESDGTNREKQTYDERCEQIAREMFYMMQEVEASEFGT